MATPKKVPKSVQTRIVVVRWYLHNDMLTYIIYVFVYIQFFISFPPVFFHFSALGLPTGLPPMPERSWPAAVARYSRPGRRPARNGKGWSQYFMVFDYQWVNIRVLMKHLVTKNWEFQSVSHCPTSSHFYVPNMFMIVVSCFVYFGGISSTSGQTSELGGMRRSKVLQLFNKKWREENWLGVCPSYWWHVAIEAST